MLGYGRCGLAAMCLAIVVAAGCATAQGKPGGDQASAKPSTGSPTSATGASAPASTAGEAASEASQPKQVQGRVELIDRANNVTIAGSESAGLAFDKFKLDSATVVTSEGARRSIADLNEGDEVRATLSVAGDLLHVDRIEILPATSTGPSTGTGDTRPNPDASRSSSDAR